MSGFTDTTEQGLLDYFIATYGASTKYVALSSTTPTEAGGNFTEPSTGSYARVSTTSSDWGAASGTAPATKSNTTVKTFPTATANWASGSNLTHWGLYDASTSGSLLVWGLLTVAKPVLTGDVPTCGVGSLVVKLGDSTDSF